MNRSLLKGYQPKELNKEWIDLVGRIQKGSKLEKEMTECLMKWYGAHELWNETQLDGMTPIFIAVRFGYINIVEFIASYKDNPYSSKSDKATPFHIAARYKFGS